MTTIGYIKGDARSLDYGSFRPGAACAGVSAGSSHGRDGDWSNRTSVEFDSMYQDPPCTLNWGYMVPNSGYLGPNRG